LKLDITPGSVALDGLVDFSTWTGSVGTTTLTYLVDIDGTPVSLLAMQGAFDAAGRFQVSGRIPNDPGLSGLDLTFVAFGFDSIGDLAATNLETLQIQ
jgi:hypothetical protein